MNLRNRFNVFSILPLLTLSVMLISFSKVQAVPAPPSLPNVPGQSSLSTGQNLHQGYIDFFEKVYKTMDENYYQPVSREIFNRFIEQFNNKIYNQLKVQGKTDNYVKWRSASILVEKLKSPDDTFSGLYPPKPAVEFKQSSLGTRVDLGIEGKPSAQGYEVTRVEPHSDAYTEGLRELDIIFQINKKKVNKLSDDQIKDLLNPLVNTKVNLKFLDASDHQEKAIDVVSKEYFKQTVFMVPTKVAGIYGLRIEHFNQKTGEDLFRFMEFMKKRGPIKGLIIDLRNNPGGPPLAAREIASIFLPGGEQFAYFQRRGEPQSWLDVPKLPEQYHYDGPMAILINSGSGSSSELFAGILQKRGRAVLMGSHSAGKVFLKSMFDFDDQSMIVLVTGRGHYPNGSVFSFQGLTPDHALTEEKDGDSINYATLYLVYVNRKSQ